MKTLLSILLFALLGVVAALAETVTFEWDHAAPGTVSDYALYRIDGENKTLVGKTKVLQITAEVTPGQTFGVVAINADGLESDMSATLTLAAKPVPPGKPRVVKLQSGNGKEKWKDFAELDFKPAKASKK